MSESLIIDRIVPVVGRIRRASGTTNTRAFNRIQSAIDQMIDNADIQSLEKIKSGELRLLTLATPDYVVPAPVRQAGDLRGKASPRYVYFILREDTQEVKIGIASDVADRLRALQTGCAGRLTLLATTPGGKPTERALHTLFASHRLHGEWFRYAPEIQEYVAEIAI